MHIISETELRVATKAGHIVRFYEGQSKHCSEEIGLLALQLGATQYTDSYVPPVVAVVEEIKEDTVPDLDFVTAGITCPSNLIREVMIQLIKKGSPQDFKKDGTPKGNVVNKMTGRMTTLEEREVAWEQALNT